VKQPFILLPAAGVLLLSVVCVAQHDTSSKSAGSGSCLPVADEVLKCPKFGFTYKVPFGWVNRTQEMQDSSGPDLNAADKPRDQSNGSCQGTAGRQSTSSRDPTSKIAPSETLLAIFERPPDAPGKTINSAVVIATESRESYPAVKTAADYFGAISDLAEHRGLKAASDPYAFTIGAKQLVREEFNGERGKLPIFQSSLVMIERGEIVSFTFIGGSEDEVNDLIGNLSCAAGNPRQVPHR